MKFTYKIVVESGPYKDKVIRHYGGTNEIFSDGKWQPFNILEQGLENGYETKSITENEGMEIVGEKFHDGEERVIKIHEEGESKYGNMSLSELMEEVNKRIK